jgi:hypothetical protein
MLRFRKVAAQMVTHTIDIGGMGSNAKTQSLFEKEEGCGSD